MSAWVQERNGRWRAFRREGGRMVALGTFESKEDARAMIDGKVPTVAEVMKSWLLAVDVKPSTKASYEIRAAHVLRPDLEVAIGDWPVDELDGASVRAFWRSLRKAGLGERHAHGVVATLRTALSAAVERGWLPRNPAAGLRIPKGRPPDVDVRTKEQLLALATAAPKWHRALVLTLGTTGLRVGEAAGLRIGDLDMDRRIFRIATNLVTVGGRHYEGTPKSGKERLVSIPLFLATELRCHVAAYRAEATPSDRVFVARDKGELDAANVRRMLNGAAARAGQQPLTTHSLRNTAASLALNAGADMRDIQNMLGHAQLETTFLYLQRIRRDPVATDVADRLDAMFSE